MGTQHNTAALSAARTAAKDAFESWVFANLDHVVEEFHRQPGALSVSQLCWLGHEQETFLLCMTVAGFNHLKIPAIADFMAACSASDDLAEDLKNGQINTDSVLKMAIGATAAIRACWPLSIRQRADALRDKMLAGYIGMPQTRAIYARFDFRFV